MELAHHGGAELIVHMALQQPGYALPDGPQVQAGDPCGLSVPLRGIYCILRKVSAFFYFLISTTPASSIPSLKS